MKAPVDVQLVTRCVVAAGYFKGPKLAQFIAFWAVAEHDLGHRVGIEEFGDWSPYSTRTAYRHLASFRSVFPELGDQGIPGDLVRMSSADRIEWVGLSTV